MQNIRPAQIYTKQAAIKRLGVSRARYEQLIESGILPKPVALIPGARPIHTERQIQTAERNLEEMMMRDFYAARERDRAKGYKPTKPIKPLAPGETSNSRLAK